MAGWERYAVANPLSVFSRVDYARSPQVGEVAADLWLAKLQRFDEIANANFVFSDQAQDTQTGGVGESPEQAGRRNRDFLGHAKEYHNICLDIYDLARLD
jgi:hypothetical protein